MLQHFLLQQIYVPGLYYKAEVHHSSFTIHAQVFLTQVFQKLYKIENNKHI